LEGYNCNFNFNLLQLQINGGSVSSI
jgi:hypothetical protein